MTQRDYRRTAAAVRWARAQELVAPLSRRLQRHTRAILKRARRAVREGR
jgi:hypothetical protein